MLRQFREQSILTGSRISRRNRAAIMDMIYCGGATQINAFFCARLLLTWLSGSWIRLLLYLGIKSLKAEGENTFSADTGRYKTRTQSWGASGLHVKKAVLSPRCFLESSLCFERGRIPEWIFITAFWHNREFILSEFPMLLLLPLLQGLYCRMVFHSYKIFLEKEGCVKTADALSDKSFCRLAMLAFGVYFGYQIIFKTDWTRCMTVEEHVKQQRIVYQFEITPNKRSFDNLSSAFFRRLLSLQSLRNR